MDGVPECRPLSIPRICSRWLTVLDVDEGQSGGMSFQDAT